MVKIFPLKHKYGCNDFGRNELSAWSEIESTNKTRKHCWETSAHSCCRLLMRSLAYGLSRAVLGLIGEGSQALFSSVERPIMP